MMTTVTEENFNRAVLASSVPVFVHFRAPWCSICRLISPVLESCQTDWHDAVRIVEINADENFKLANQYQLKTLPTLLYIANGKVLHRIEGFRSREALKAQLQDIVQQHDLEGAVSSVAFSRSA
ncbi:MAG: thioredoxin fold domain-containing protein [Phormidesmis sp. RL_2_1]|nr:thioredoxin fold domain-containing protein [Phormidesmis sp. RL_2_1]